jgi:hypothetical protein
MAGLPYRLLAFGESGYTPMKACCPGVRKPTARRSGHGTLEPALDPPLVAGVFAAELHF